MTEPRFYLVREDILPEGLLRTLQAKDLLVRGEVRTVHEAAEKVGLSRSAFYKYKDGVFALDRLETERLVTISMDLHHRSGILSGVLAAIARAEGNVLSINQTIPLQGVAHVVLTVDATHMGDRLSELVGMLEQADGVSRVAVVAQG